FRVPLPAAIFKCPRYLDGWGSLFVSGSSLLFGVFQAVFGETGIAQSAADALQFGQQFPEKFVVGRQARLLQIALNLFLTALEMNAAQGADGGFENFCR